MQKHFGDYIRRRREDLQRVAPGQYSVRKLAAAIGIEPSYLSKVERGQQAPPGERTIIALAQELQVDADMLLALAGKVSEELQEIIRARPQLFATLLRELKDIPDHMVQRLASEIRESKS